MVTGAGKTILAEMCLAEFLRQNDAARVLILVPTQALLDQWYVSLREDLGVPEADLASYSGGGKPDKPSIINILVLNTARDWAPRLLEPATMLIVDECHRAASPENARSLSGDHRATLGLSATPEREYDEYLIAVLEPALGPIIFEYSYAEARKDGVISPFELINVEVPLHPSEASEYERLSSRIARRMANGSMAGDDETLKLLLLHRARLAARARYRVPVATRLAADADARTLIFHESIAAANEISGLLTKRGISNALYHSKLSRPHRQDNLRLYRRGAFRILVTCRALDEGVDVPETSVAIIASATASRRQRVQRLGRTLRPSAGKIRAIVYTLYATEAEKERLVQENATDTGADSISWMRSSLG